MVQTMDKREGGRVMTYDEAYNRLDEMVESGEMTEEEAREELFFFEMEGE